MEETAVPPYAVVDCTLLYIYSAEPVVIETESTECWPCPLFDILLKKYFPAG
jgi:hypothetical protein